LEVLMDGTSQSIDRIRRARKTGPEMMADLDRLPWRLDPHHSVTKSYAPGATDVPMDGSSPYTQVADEALQDMERNAQDEMAGGSGSAFQQHQYLNAPPYGADDVGTPLSTLRNPDAIGHSRLDEDDWERKQTGLSSQDWEESGLGMNNQDRMRAMSEQRVAADKAQFDQNAAIEARRAPVREQSDREFAEWEAGKQGRMDSAAQEREAFHNERRAKKAQQDAADSEAGLQAKLGADLTPAPNFVFDPVQKQANLAAEKENDKITKAAKADQKIYDKDFGSLPVESTPMEAPLPGEETLPPAVAGWAQRRAERGQGGLNALRARYHREVPEDARSGSDLHNFEGWLARNGIKPDMSVMDAMPILNGLSPMDAGHVDRRKEQYINTMMKRHAAEMAQSGVTEQQLRAAYEGGVKADAIQRANAEIDRAFPGITPEERKQRLEKMVPEYMTNGDPILTGSRAVNKMFVTGFKNTRDQQIALNHKKHIDQRNRANSFGVPVGTVQFFDSLQAAKTPEERQNIFMLAHSRHPHMGYDKVAAMLMKGEIDNDAMTRWAQTMGGNAKPNPIDQVGANNNLISNGPLTPATLAQAHAEASRENQGAKPAELRAVIANRMLPAIRRHVASGKPWDIHATTTASQVLSTEPADFAFQIGLPPNDPRVGQLYQQIHGRPLPQGWINQALTGIGQWFTMGGNQAQAGEIPPDVKAWGGGT
jgi:hypothetical protein